MFSKKRCSKPLPFDIDRYGTKDVLCASDDDVVGDALMRWIVAYFRHCGVVKRNWNGEQVARKQSKQHSKQQQTTLESHFGGHNKSTSNIASTTTTTTSHCFIPALYLQHRGHSRTVVGVEFKPDGSLLNLLILDPSTSHRDIQFALDKARVSPLRRSPKTLQKKDEYEIVFIDPTKSMLIDTSSLSSFEPNQLKKLNSL